MITTKTPKASVPVLLALMLVTGCGTLDELLSVPAPSQVVASELEGPASAQLLVASVANEFRCTHTYHATASAITGNEWRDASNNTVMNIWDARIHDTSGYGSQYASADCGSGQPALYRPLSRTRWLADHVLGLLDGWTEDEVPARREMIAEVALYSGYTYTLFAETMCELAFDNGPVVTPDAAFALAIQRFDRAVEAGASGDMLNAVRVGKARAQLNLGQAAAAAATASAVPEGFQWLLPFSAVESVTKNKQWEFNVDTNVATVAEPYRAFPCNFPWPPDDAMSGCTEELDPRVQVIDQMREHTNTGIALWFAAKYEDAGSPVQLASWEEAQLIIAEAAIEAGDYGAAVSIFDALRANVGLSPYAGPMDGVALRDQLIEERAAELFLEGHHLWDMRRLGIRPYPPVGQDDGFGAVYGNQLCFDLPATEFQNNTTITGG